MNLKRGCDPASNVYPNKHFMSQKLNKNLSEPGNNIELEKYCNDEVPIIKIQKSIPDQKPISLPNRPLSGTELKMQ